MAQKVLAHLAQVFVTTLEQFVNKVESIYNKNISLLVEVTHLIGLYSCQKRARFTIFFKIIFCANMYKCKTGLIGKLVVWTIETVKENRACERKLSGYLLVYRIHYLILVVRSGQDRAVSLLVRSSRKIFQTSRMHVILGYRMSLIRKNK